MGIYKLRSLTKFNMKFLLDYEFLRDGRYTNVASGQTFYDGSDMSLLQCDTSNDDLLGLSDGQVWQSPFRNWVYESGIVLNDSIGIRDLDLPILCSGVYVDNIFRATSPTHPDYNAGFSHHIDWINGRVIFDSVQPLTSQVQASFAYKHIRIAFEHDFNNQFRSSYLESKFTTNPLTSNNIVYPSGQAYPFPAVFIENAGRRWSAYELGNRSLISADRMIFHIWALDDITRDDIVDMISFQDSKRIPIIDFNLAPFPLSGIYNEMSPEYIPYQNLLKNPTINVPGSRNGTASTIAYIADINDTDTMNDAPYEEFERSRVEFVINLYTIQPNGSLGINDGAYQFRGGTEDF